MVDCRWKLWSLHARPLVPAVCWIGEDDVASRVEDQVVGTVEPSAAVIVEDGFSLACRGVDTVQTTDGASIRHKIDVAIMVGTAVDIVQRRVRLQRTSLRDVSVALQRSHDIEHTS